MLGFYWPIRGEFDPRRAIMTLLEREWRAALPVVVGKDVPLEYRAWTPDTVMERGALGIMAPREGAPVLPDAVLAPVVGFDDSIVSGSAMAAAISTALSPILIHRRSPSA